MIAKRIVLVFLGALILSTCGGDEGGVHLTIAIDNSNVVRYVDANCASLEGKTMVGVLTENCSDYFNLSACSAYSFTFENLNGCKDVQGLPAGSNNAFIVINACSGIITGTLDGQTGSCILRANSTAPDCTCELDTVNLPTAHNADFAAKVTEGVTLLREKVELARDNVVLSVGDPASALWVEQTGPNFIFPCDAL